MKFFRINVEKKGNILPCIRAWTEKLDYHAVQAGEFFKLPRRTLLYVDSHPETLFADVLETPFYLVSDMVWGVMKKYEEGIKGREIVLLDGIFGVAEVYHIPILRECRPPETKQEWQDAPSFFRCYGEHKNYMIGRLDFVESILRRGAEGLRLEEVHEG